MFAQSDLVAETGKLQKFALRLTKNKTDAEDLFQSTFLRALEKEHYFEEGTNLFSWASIIMYNIFVTDYRRRTKFETQYDPENYLEKEIIEPTQDTSAELANINRAMMKMSLDHRKVLISVCAKGMNYAEVSEMLQIPVGIVRSRLSRAREQLQAIMDKSSTSAIPQAAIQKEPANDNMPLIPAYIASHALQKISLKNA